jgi:hypothetical protein
MNIPLAALTRESSIAARYCTDASDLGLPAGRWPKFLALDNGAVLPLQGFAPDGTHTYSDGTTTVRVFND